MKLTVFSKILITLVVVGAVGAGIYVNRDKLAPKAKTVDSQVPPPAKLPDTPSTDTPKGTPQPKAPALAEAKPGCTDKPEVRFYHWAWNAQMGLMYATGGKQAAEAVRALGPFYLERFQALEAIAEEIRKLAGDNPSLETQLVQTEMDKLGKLLHTFLQMAVVHQRLAGYLEEGYEAEIQRDIDRCQKALGREKNAEVLSTVRQSLGLAEKRMKQHASIEASFKVVSVKMETLEKSFSYLKSHVIAIASQEELAQEIEELITGVEAVEDLGVETESLISDIGRARAAQAARQGVK